MFQHSRFWPILWSCFGIALATVGTAGRSEAAEEVEESTGNDGDVRLIPRRQLRFARSKDEYTMRLFKADPKLLERRYLAVIRLGSAGRPSGKRLIPNELSQMFYYESADLTSSGAFIVALYRPTPANYFGRLLKNMPENRRPGKDEISFFETAARP